MSWDDTSLLWGEDDLMPAGWVRPNYTGRGYANIPATVGALLGAHVGELPPLDEALWRPLAEGVERIVLVLVDGLGWRRLLRTDPAALERWRAAGGIAAPLTSVCPSTTAAATTTLWTGAAPAAHGFMGYMQHLPRMGAVCDMIFFRAGLSDRTGELIDWGLDPLSLTPSPGTGEWLARAGVPTTAILARGILNSPLSTLHYRGVGTRVGHHGASDFWLRLRESVEARAGQRAYIAAYWAMVDTLGHMCGPDEVSWESEWRALRYFIEEEFLGRLSPAARRGALFILTADHGQIPNDAAEIIPYRDHPGLAGLLQTLPAGDPRHVYLWPRAGARDEIAAYVRERFPDFLLFDRDALLDAGLYGPTVWPEVRARIGDLVMLAAGRRMFLWLHRQVPFRGMHGGLLPDEALVPWLARRLDG
jgi:predicted AlkP superfamily pyrophosphatase or phosphodiesterase